MPVSEVSICNHALSLLGAGRITSLTLPSEEDPGLARRVGLCRDLYAPTRDAMLEENTWTFATRETRLAREAADPEFGYSMQFVLPPDCLNVWWAGQNEEWPLDRWERVGNRIYAEPSQSAEFLYIWYTRREEDTTKFTPGFVVALATRLAAEMCYAITESGSRAQSLWQEYAFKVEQALAAEGQQGRTRVTRTPGFTRHRGGSSPYFVSGASGTWR